MQNSLISPADAATELLTRRQARQSLQAFTEYTTLNWKAGRIHREICEQLDRVVRKDIKRLIIACPPQHGKSTVASKRLAAFVLGKTPTTDVISASATSGLAEEFGRDTRNCIASSEYRSLFPDTVLAEDSQAKGRWNTSHGGGYYAIGVGGALMGRGAELGLIDDPFSTWEEGQSQLVRNKVWDWYQGTFYNRIRPGGAIVVIEHRMAEDDLIGRLIEQQKAGGLDQWTIVEIPADLNNPPWVERYNRDELLLLKSAQGPRKWAALYMQNPTPEEGTFFKREWFNLVDPKKVSGHAYTTGDFAVTEGDGDFTELGTHKYSGDRLTLGIAGWRGQTSADVWIEHLIEQFATYKPLCFFGESGPIRRSIEPFLRRRMSERRKYCRLEWLVRSHDKATMARPLQAMAASGKVDIADTEYGHHLLSQLLQFPAGRLDDAVDMAGLMGMARGGGEDGAHPAIVPLALVKTEKRDGWDDEKEESNWKTA
jgi:hypothetical protein